MTIRIGGLAPLSTTDYPGELAAVAFCQGCPWRCRYCHNPHLLPARGTAEIAWDAVMAFLEKRRGLLDAVVFSGGEPTLQRGLAQAMREVKSLGFKTGLHTAGASPRRLQDVLPLVDWIGLDVKVPFEEYAQLTAARASGSAARRSLQIVLESGVPYECRTTANAALIPMAKLEALADGLARLGVRHYAVQAMRETHGAGTGGASGTSYSAQTVSERLAGRFSSFVFRAA